MKNCFKIIFNSNWSKRRFLEGMKSDFINSEKLVVVNQSAKKNNFKIKKKRKLITFVGKLNKSKGYDLFGKAVIKILNKYKNVWCHGDYILKTENNGFIIFGRSDANLNPGGVRIGTAEIYRQVEKIETVRKVGKVGNVETLEKLEKLQF